MNIVEQGDSLHLLDKVEESSVQTIYFDPPFNTQKIWIMAPDDETGFSDIWESNQTYIDFIEQIIWGINISSADIWKKKEPFFVNFFLHFTTIGSIKSI